MTVHYREFGVPVDPEFACELKAQLDARRVRQSEPSPADDRLIQLPRITEVTLVPIALEQADRRWRHMGLLAAAVVAVLVAGTVLVLATSDDDTDLRPADTPPSATADRRFAAAVALTPFEWGADYTFGRWATQFRMTREVAETVPECEPFLDTVFESPGRPATVTTATAATGTRVIPVRWQYVVVFPDVTGAEAMMAALHDPRYPECDLRYRGALSELDHHSYFGSGVPLQRDLAGDDSVLVNTHPFVRAGRTVMAFDSDYEDIVARAVDRVEAAEAGAPLASVALPLEYLTKAAVMKLGDDLSAGWSQSEAHTEWMLDRSAGLSVPSCAAFVDVFIHPPVPTWGDDEYDESKPLAYIPGTLETDPQGRDAPAGVFRVIAIGYRRQQDAEDAMDEISDPGFAQCLADYTSAEPPNAAWQATTREPISVSALSSPLGDESVQMLFEGRYIGLDGTTAPTGRIVDVFIRVDQVLLGVEVTPDHMSTDELESVLQNMVDLTEAAVAGAPFPFSFCTDPRDCPD